MEHLRMEHLNGGIVWMIMAAFAFYILGFASVGWERSGDKWIGLWMNCSAAFQSYSGQSWHKAAQALMSIGLILLVFAMAALLFLYRKIYAKQKTTSGESATEPISVKRPTCHWAVFFILTFLAATSMGIGFFVYGVKHSYHLNWSFVFCIIGAGFCVLTLVYGLWSYCTSCIHCSMKLTSCINCNVRID